MSQAVRIEVHRYDPAVDDEPRYETYEVPWEPHMKLLDALRHIQREDPSLAFRWNCGEGVCGSDAMRLDGRPVLACKTTIPEAWTERDEPPRVEPLKVFPVIKDLVADYSEVWQKAQKFKPHFEGEEPDNQFYEMHEEEVEQAQQMRKCISCMACYDVCHVLREQMKEYAGPRNLVKVASLTYHPKDVLDRSALLDGEGYVELCNVTRCCSSVCPQDINITQDAIIPHKERGVAGDETDPVMRAGKHLRETKQAIKERMRGGSTDADA